MTLQYLVGSQGHVDSAVSTDQAGPCWLGTKCDSLTKGTKEMGDVGGFPLSWEVNMEHMFSSRYHCNRIHYNGRNIKFLK